jgi:hypothetical protein
VDADRLFTISKSGHFSANIDVAIIDSGIDLDHPDLNIFHSITSIIPENPSSSSSSDTLIKSGIDREKIGIDSENNTALDPPFSRICFHKFLKIET